MNITLLFKIMAVIKFHPLHGLIKPSRPFTTTKTSTKPETTQAWQRKKAVLNSQQSLFNTKKDQTLQSKWKLHYVSLSLTASHRRQALFRRIAYRLVLGVSPLKEIHPLSFWCTVLVSQSSPPITTTRVLNLPTHNSTIRIKAKQLLKAREFFWRSFWKSRGSQQSFRKTREV